MYIRAKSLNIWYKASNITSFEKKIENKNWIKTTAKRKTFSEICRFLKGIAKISRCKNIRYMDSHLYVILPKMEGKVTNMGTYNLGLHVRACIKTFTTRGICLPVDSCGISPLLLISKYFA